MFGPSGALRPGTPVEVTCRDGLPATVRTRRVVLAVVEVEARWRDWRIDGIDLECWRVLTEPPLVVVLGLDLRAGSWTVITVWD